MPSEKINPPTADVLMDSMRSMGYSFESAISDIIDNSISASASRIEILFPSDPHDCYVAVLDNGTGMDFDELEKAMKYGSQSKHQQRGDNDLGRFGLGLKAASLSQCRKLTVVSKKNGEYSAFAWNLDLVEAKHDWVMECYDSTEIPNLLCFNELQKTEHGTLVIWENFDFIELSTGAVYTNLSEKLDDSKKYISLIFHRFLNGSGAPKVEILINHNKIIGCDPFLENHKKTDQRKTVSIAVKDDKGIERNIRVQGFVLPFQKDLTQADIVKIGGENNYQTKQGFYVYRNNRLIIWGTWFKMKPKYELTKHARLKVDIPNSLDDVWGIDIKKQNAVLPRIIRDQLVGSIEDVMNIAEKAQHFRGRVENKDELTDFVWNRIPKRDGKVSYAINTDSKIFELLNSDEVSDEARSLFELILSDIERCLPVQQIYIDMSKNVVEGDDKDEAVNNEIIHKAAMLSKMAKKMNPQRSFSEIVNELFSLHEPFTNYKQLIKNVIKECENNG